MMVPAVSKSSSSSIHFANLCHPLPKLPPNQWISRTLRWPCSMNLNPFSMFGASIFRTDLTCEDSCGREPSKNPWIYRSVQSKSIDEMADQLKKKETIPILPQKDPPFQYSNSSALQSSRTNPWGQTQGKIWKNITGSVTFSTVSFWVRFTSQLCKQGRRSHKFWSWKMPV